MDKTLIYLRCDAIGDAILSAGMIAPIRQAYPDHKIIVICQDICQVVYSKCPLVDRIVSFNRPSIFDDEKYRMELFEQVHALGAQVCINPVFSRDDCGDHFAAATQAILRFGHHGDLSNLKKARRDENNIAYTHLVELVFPDQNELRRHQEFLQVLKIPAPPLMPQIWTDAADVQFADQIFTAHGLPQRGALAPGGVIGLYAGAQYTIRLYPHFAEAIARTTAQRGLFLIGLGTASEWDLNQDVLAACGGPYLNLCGKTTILQTAEIMRRCTMVVGNETSLTHIACAVGTPNVSILGGGHFGRFLPYSPLTSVVCLPLGCFHCNWDCKFDRTHCVTDISPLVLEAAIRDRLDKPAGNLPRVFFQDEKLWRSPPGGPQWQWQPQMIPVPIEITRVTVK